MNCYALLELMHARPVPEVLSLYTKYRPRSLSRTALESVAISSSLLIYHFAYTLKAPVPPAYLRQHVTESMRSFPGNTLLLGVWLETERSEAVWGRVRSGISDIVLGSTGGQAVSCVRWIWSIWVETWERGVWEPSRARLVLRKALDDPR
jgi:hypothetical protein